MQWRFYTMKNILSIIMIELLKQCLSTDRLVTKYVIIWQPTHIWFHKTKQVLSTAIQGSVNFKE